MAVETYMALEPNRPEDTECPRIYYSDGRVDRFDDTDAGQRLAYQVWLALPKGIRAAFRGRNVTTPVYSHDYVDRR